MSRLSRRRFLIMSAACAALPAAASGAPVAHWRGIALGARASLDLVGLSEAEAAPLLSSIEAELNRLEDIFSLYRSRSQISELNRSGLLQQPAPELLNVLSLCSTLHSASDGAFDPTIQPVWRAMAARASASELTAAQETVGWHRVRYDADAIQLPVPGVSALTLNGIAQGAITDRIAALLRSFGLRDVLVNMGEIAAMGQRGDGQDWRVGLAGHNNTVHKKITLRERSVATSSVAGTLLPGDHGHILNPFGPSPSNHTVSISAPNAALADGLSTALCAVPKEWTGRILQSFPLASLELSG
ncbi:FAD:protein FMN transferase [Ruegeria faecimaris]|uniref:FAD:protein FMN transferase n=1 Tax=Ruegeria faecimaris TaxID=686389 RepID=UPI002491BA9F|nr:FAD:protein FMN transferase [Ruegeria faecimaris]